MGEPIDVVMVDDHQIFRRGLRVILEEPGEPAIHLVGEAHDAPSALALIEATVPDVLLADLQLGHDFEPGLALIRQTRHLSPHTRVLVLTAWHDSQYLFQAFQAGASGCIAKADQLASAEIRRAIAEVAGGGYYSSTLVLKRLHDLLQRGEDLTTLMVDPLTRREREVLALIAQGHSNQQIATHLVIGIKTVKTHVSNILDKLQLESRYHAAMYYRMRAGTPPDS